MCIRDSRNRERARRSASTPIWHNARENADRIRNEADAKAREVIRQALNEKQNELAEIDRLKASREEFKACLLYTSTRPRGARG